VFLFLLSSCKNNKLKIEKYFNGIPVQSKTEVKSIFNNGKEIKLILIDNLLDIDSSYRMRYYINNQLYYDSSFANIVSVNIQLNENELCNCIIEFEKNNKKYLLTNKSIFYWDNKIKYIYYQILLSDSSDNDIVFIPSTHSI
jgi:hypothetical protein